MSLTVDVAIIGAGSAGLYALSQVKRHTDNFVVVNGGPLGTTCARVGCMPSKVAIQVAEDFHHRKALADEGIHGGDTLSIDRAAALAHVRSLRDVFTGRATNKTLTGIGDKLIRGYARFTAPTDLAVELEDGGSEAISAKAVIIAAGSRPVVPGPWRAFGDKVLTTDTLFEQPDLPERLAILGLGVIGLEIGQALHRMGVEVSGFDMLDTIAGLTDPAIRDAAVQAIGTEFPLHLGQAAQVEAEGEALRVSAGSHSVVVDKILASVGRVPNIDSLGLEALGLSLNERGMPPFNPATMQIADLPVFIAGDVNGERQLLHEAADEGRIAGYNAATGQTKAFQRKTPLGITFCDPNIATVGAPWQALEDREDVCVGTVNFETASRALVMGKNRGLLRVYGRKQDGLLLGAAMVAPRGEHLAHELAWAIEQGLTVFDMLRLPFYHPVIEEAMQSALSDLASQCEGRPDPKAGPMELVPLE